VSTREAPFSRTFVDGALPWLRAGLGMAFIAYSANATIFIGADDMMWLFDSTTQITIGGFPDAYWYSAILAIIIFVGEVATSERYLKAYLLFLAPDVFYTARGVFAGLSKALAVLAAPIVGQNKAATIVGVALAVPLAAAVGYIIAKWGETLLFGRRRSRRPAKRED